MKMFSKISVVLFAPLFLFGLTGPMTALAAGPMAINLGAAGNFTILAKTGISATGATSIVGDIGVSPAAATYITGFGLILPSYGAYSTSAVVNGKVYASDYYTPTPINLTTAILNMQTAYTDGAGRTNPSATELGAGNIGGLTIAPGLYKWSTGVTIPTNLTLSGGSNDVWIFVVAQNLNVSSAAKVILSGGAQAGNIYWVVAGQTTLGTAAVFNGNILDQTAIILNTGARLNGRALAQTAVTLDANTVTAPTAAGSAIVESPMTQAAPVSVVTPLVAVNQSAEANTPAANSASSETTSYTAPATSACSSTQHSCQCATGSYCLFMGGMCLSPDSPCPGSEQAMESANFGQEIRAIAVNIGTGSRSNNVKILQEFLISQDKGPSAQALSRVGATAYFGGLTRKALAEFQAKVGIKPSLGNFGPITRAYVSAHFSQ